MLWLAFLVPWIVVGAIIAFIAFWGGAGGAREAYLTRGRRLFRIVIPLVYIGVGIAVPAVVLAGRGEREGATDTLAKRALKNADLEHGKELFESTCASCHSLAAVNARGVTGPNLDRIGQVTPSRVLSAIRVGGTGQGRMPAGLLTGTDAQDVAKFVASVAGK